MEPFNDRGWFWLPNHGEEERARTGVLAFDGNDFRLELDEPLAIADDEAGATIAFEEGSHAVVYGRLRERGDVTLLEARGRNLNSFSGVPAEMWIAQRALLGPHVADLTFASASVAFDLLPAWACPPPIASRAGELGVHTLDARRSELASTTVDGATITLGVWWQGSIGPDVVDVERTCWITIRSRMTLDDVMNDWVVPLQDLLITLVGRPVRITSLSVRPDEDSDPAESLRALFGGLRTGEPDTTSSIHLQGWGSPSLFLRPELPVPLEQLIAGWFDVWRRFRPAIIQSFSPFHAPFTYAENQYAAQFLGIEALAKGLYPGRQLPPKDHRARVGAIVDAATAAGVAADILDWATAVLTGANNIPPRELIARLLDEEAELTSPLVEAVPDFAREATGLRNGVAHARSNSTQMSPAARRYWIGEVLLLLVRARLLIEAGVPRQDVHEIIRTRGVFTQAVRALQLSESPSSTDS